MNRFRTLWALAAVLAAMGILVVATNRSSTRRPASHDDPLRDFVIGEPIVCRNLTIFAVSSKSPRMDDRFITLDEGLGTGKVEVFEKGAMAQSPPRGQTPAPQAAEDPFASGEEVFAGGNEVNELMVVNRSERPLYLMPGEIIVGGSQDRTIGQELVVVPDGKPVPIDVYCVEHGRWGGRDEAEYVNLSLVISQTRAVSWAASGGREPDPRDVALQANAGKFIGSVGSLSKPARLAVHSSDGQQKVILPATTSKSFPSLKRASILSMRRWGQ